MNNRFNNRYLLLIILIIGLIFLGSSYGKIFEGKFVDSLGGILTKFASQNPYPWYKQFLENVAIPNVQTFAVLTMWAELLVGFAIITSVIYLLATRSENKIMVLLLVGINWCNVSKRCILTSFRMDFSIYR